LARDGSGHLNALVAVTAKEIAPTSPVPLNRRKSGLHSQPGYFRKENISCPCSEN